MATLRTVAFLLAATFVTVQSQASNKRESLNFLQQANSFDPDNLNEDEGFYYPDEAELPNGDHQVVYNGPEGREACVVCQKSSFNDDSITAALRRLQSDVELLKKKLGRQDGLTSSKDTKEDKEKKPPKISILPAPVPKEPPKISLLPAPLPEDAPKISPLPAPAPKDTPKISLLPAPVPKDTPKISPLPAPAPGDVPKISPLPAPAPKDTPKISPLPAPAPENEPEMSILPAPASEPLLPNEDPEEILKDISGLDPKSLDPSVKKSLDKMKQLLDKRTDAAEEPTTAEGKQAQDKELIDAKTSFEKQIENEKDPKIKSFLVGICKRIQSYITKTSFIEIIRTSSGKETKIVSRSSVSVKGKIKIGDSDDNVVSESDIKFDGSGLPDLSQLLAASKEQIKQKLANNPLIPAKDKKNDKP